MTSHAVYGDCVSVGYVFRSRNRLERVHASPYARRICVRGRDYTHTYTHGERARDFGFYIAQHFKKTSFQLSQSAFKCVLYVVANALRHAHRQKSRRFVSVVHLH